MSKNTSQQMPECLCGCGGTTKGGRYLRGHDAKHKSALISKALAGSKRAAAKLEEFGWARFLHAKRPPEPSEGSKRKGRRPACEPADKAPEIELLPSPVEFPPPTDTAETSPLLA